MKMIIGSRINRLLFFISNFGIVMKDKITVIAEDTVSALGYILVEAKRIPGRAGMVLRVVIHKKNADVSMKDCASVSNVLLRRLEVEIRGFSEKYALVVESPGADRKIGSMRELSLFQDREMLFSLKDPAKLGLLDGRISGKPSEISGSSFKVLYEGRVLELDWNDITGVKLYFNIKDYL